MGYGSGDGSGSGMVVSPPKRDVTKRSLSGVDARMMFLAVWWMFCTKDS